MKPLLAYTPSMKLNLMAGSDSRMWAESDEMFILSVAMMTTLKTMKSMLHI